ncbi:MAG: VWA domain-containing protein [Paludibacteraceae bacterium]|nr:VWA domain-containing protein [Paludibacteraceae bacterium]
MSFQNPAYFWLLLLLIPIIVWYIVEMRKADASLQISGTDSFKGQPKSVRIYMLHLPFLLRVAALLLLTIGLARPQLTDHWHSEQTEGIDIMMALDISGTMQAEDLRPNRLEAAKIVSVEFINARVNDNIGLVVFAGESFTQCPLTTDHAVLINLFNSVKFGMIQDGTAIGLGIANAVNRMKDSPTKSKVIILLTDGSNNAGDIDPLTAAKIANQFGIRIYAIGVGSRGQARIPYQTPIGVQYATISGEFDEQTLRQVADQTGGEYFRATDNASLKRIYEQIDQMEKTKIRVREISKKQENFSPFILWAMLLLLCEITLRGFVLRTIAQ